jgi:hypothetical protein
MVRGWFLWLASRKQPAYFYRIEVAQCHRFVTVSGGSMPGNNAAGGIRAFTGSFEFALAMAPDLESIRATSLHPLLSDLKPNVIELFNYGFTQGVNNVLQHAGAAQVLVEVHSAANKRRLMVGDDGRGIFEALCAQFKLPGVYEACAKLAKAEFPGDGLFFAARVFDEFTLHSGHLLLARIIGDNWTLSEHDVYQPGTKVIMGIHPRTPRTLQEVFDQYAEGRKVQGRVRINVEVRRAANTAEGVQYEHSRAGGKLQKTTGENLESAEQAATLLAPLGAFNEIFLDFTGVSRAGEEFAKQLAAFQSQHPAITLSWGNANTDVEATLNTYHEEIAKQAVA